MFKCEFCLNSLSSKSSLSRHKNTNLKCITIQKSRCIQPKSDKTDMRNHYKCLCGIKYKFKKCFLKHKSECIVTYKIQLSKQNQHYENELKSKLSELKNIYEKKLADKSNNYKNELRFQLSELKKIYEKKLYDQDQNHKNALQKLEYELKLKCMETNNADFKKYMLEYAKHSTTVNQHNHITKTNNSTVNNHTVNNLQMLVQTSMKEDAIHLTRSHIMQGGKGIAKYAMEHPLKGKILCTDTSRNVLQYKNEDGLLVKDPGGKILSKCLIESIQPKVREICDTHQYDPNLYDFEYLNKLGNNGSDIYNYNPKFIASMVKELSLQAYNH